MAQLVTGGRVAIEAITLQLGFRARRLGFGAPGGGIGGGGLLGTAANEDKEDG
ncbi:MAG: hypothetical protein WCE62_05375 [Polyangiales bacterium]